MLDSQNARDCPAFGDPDLTCMYRPSYLLAFSVGNTSPIQKMSELLFTPTSFAYIPPLTIPLSDNLPPSSVHILQCSTASITRLEQVFEVMTRSQSAVRAVLN